VAEEGTAGTGELRAPPLLPRPLVDVRPLAAGGTAAWFLAFCGLAVARWGMHEPPTEWLWVCLSGVVLGLIGLGIATWQRSAATRSSRGAQRMS
jgi:hypothetical protein